MTLNECAGVFQYAQTCFEGLKAYTTEDGRIVCFRPDLNAQRLKDSCERLEMPVFPEDRFVKAVEEVVKAKSLHGFHHTAQVLHSISDHTLWEQMQ